MSNTNYKRINNRLNDELREIRMEKDFTIYAEGSVLIEVGNTKVICTATIADKVPPFLKNSGTGWLTAEYSMLPRATGERNPRESARGKVTGRTMEIQRLIGRSLRAGIDLSLLGEKTITIDCDVIQADGGTRTTSITGGQIALSLAIDKLMKAKILKKNPLTDKIAAVSVGKVGDDLLLDLNYEEDSKAKVDMNVIMNEKGELIEIQGTGEETTFTRKELNSMIDLAEIGIKKMIDLQKRVLGEEQ